MDEVVTIKSPCNGFEFTVKKEFTLKFQPGQLEKINAHDLFVDHKINMYFHNPNGPALINLNVQEGDPEREEYFLNGQLVEPDTVKKMKHNKDFNEKIDTILNEPQ